jgi:hypothetical protein
MMRLSATLTRASLCAAMAPAEGVAAAGGTKPSEKMFVEFD